MFNKITNEDYIKAKAIDMSYILNNYSVVKKQDMYSCPFHNDKTPSAKIGDNNKLHCFSCNRNASTIDIVMYMEKCDEFTAIRKLLRSNLEPVKKKNNSVIKKSKYNYKFGLSISKVLDKSNIGYIKDYLNKRCILGILTIIDDIGLEIRHNYFEDKNYICYNFKHYNFIIQKSLNGSSKRNFGTPVPTYFKRNNSNEWYICEGIEDTFSLLLAHNFNVVCLNSLSNLDKFISDIDINNKYIIATDNDNPGLKAKDKLQEIFKQHKIQSRAYDGFYTFAQKHNLKDINECFVFNKQRS